ncbi:MAG TPA: protein kinase [Vicinamibacterales bacterium]|nr:protein kinase [Vicinamibacterales bacterium]
MAFAPGTRLGPYELIAPLGAGGMGEVYRARDSRLDREVAIKVLPEHLSSPDARQRFEREARTISHLSHPHICALFDVGEASIAAVNERPVAGTEPAGREVRYLVMELLDGETLADRLRRGPLSIEQVLRAAVQMADALAAAHRQGIVHRDLKPANVMLTRSGVKLLDFGLARTTAATAAPGDSLPPTREERLTIEGSILGTIPYMAPEQLEGREADERSDIFAFGATLYEMVTGGSAFTGSTRAALISAIMTTDPAPVSSLRPEAPKPLERVIQNCLVKDPDARWQSARDLALELQAISEGLTIAAPRHTGARWKRLVPWAAVVAAAAGAALLVRSRPAGRQATQTIRFTVPPPPEYDFYYHAETRFLAVSPDGSRIAFVATSSQPSWESASPTQRIFVRSLAAAAARQVAGTEGARSLFWSPDGRSLAFFAEDELKRVDLTGGAPVSICRVTSRIGMSGTWGHDGQVLFAGARGEAIYQVAASGGTPSVLLRPDRARHESALYWPSFLPDSDRFLYLMKDADGHGTLMSDAAGEPPHTVMPLESAAQYADPGYLVFAKDATLLAQPFDARSGRVTGEAFSIADRVMYFLSTGVPCFSTSRTGTLAYRAHDDTRRLVWFDRSGRQLSAAGPPGNYLDVSIARDGHYVLFDRTKPETGTYDIWSLDLDRGTETPVTSGRDTEVFPLALPGTASMVYSLDRGELPQMYRKNLVTGRTAKLLPATDFQMPEDVSPDGTLLLYLDRGDNGLFDVWALPLAGGAPFPVLQTPFSKRDVRLSPDGHYLAMITNESGRDEVYVAPFPGPGQRVRVSTDGARALRWNAARHELLYLSDQGRLISVPIRTTPELHIGTPVPLFSIERKHGWIAFDVTPDGNRVLAVVPEVRAGELPLSVVANWTAAAAR